MIPAYDPMFFRVAEPAEPQLPAGDLYHLLPFNQKADYSFDDILARLIDGSEHMEFRPGYGPEVYTGLVKIDGMLVGAIGNRQGLLPKGYPEYADYPGIGGELYRQGLIKMNEFVTHCACDRVAPPSMDDQRIERLQCEHLNVRTNGLIIFAIWVLMAALAAIFRSRRAEFEWRGFRRWRRSAPYCCIHTISTIYRRCQGAGHFRRVAGAGILSPFHNNLTSNT